jgi:hypothetical protein
MPEKFLTKIITGKSNPTCLSTKYSMGQTKLQISVNPELLLFPPMAAKSISPLKCLPSPSRLL